MSDVNNVAVDFVGNSIMVGSNVVSMAKNYRALVIAKVISIAEKSVLVEYNNTWNYGKEGRLETYRTPLNTVVVINNL